jgi:hypothetical protein
MMDSNAELQSVLEVVIGHLFDKSVTDNPWQ